MSPLLSAQEPASCTAGLAHFHSGDFASAQDLLWQCLESRAGNENDAFYLAQTYRPLKNYASGLARADGLLKELPDNVDLLYIAAYLHYRANETVDLRLLPVRKCFCDRSGVRRSNTDPIENILDSLTLGIE